MGIPMLSLLVEWEDQCYLFWLNDKKKCYRFWLNGNTNVIFVGCMGTTNKDNIGIPIQPRKITLVFPFNQQI
jgi:hypothetical protein